jgi:type IV secretory pathway VirB2 component (pilin)
MCIVIQSIRQSIEGPNSRIPAIMGNASLGIAPSKGLACKTYTLNLIYFTLLLKITLIAAFQLYNGQRQPRL